MHISGCYRDSFEVRLEYNAPLSRGILFIRTHKLAEWIYTV